MSIFARRVLQRMINENRQFMSALQANKLVGLLNLENRQAAGAEWEVVLLNSFGKLGRVEYEPDLGGTSPPDLFVSGCDGMEPFVVEVTSVSDAGYEHENPVQDFEDAFHTLAKKKKLAPGGYHFQIGGEEIGEYPEAKTRLLLPNRREIKKFVDDEYSTFLDEIRADPNSVRTHRLKKPTLQITITYDPRRLGYSGAGYPSYTSLRARRKNALFNRLSKKARQLKNCGFEGTRGIVVCDAGASYLSSLSGGPTSFGLRDILGMFFREHLTVSYVMVVRTISSGGTISLTKELFLNGYIQTKETDNRLIEILERSINILPPPARLAVNAYRSVPGSFRLFENSHFGGGKMSSKRVTISVRTIHALLAGQLAPAQYFESHKDSVRILYVALKEGRSISGVHLEASENEDDDWLTFEIGEPDAAIGPFVPPSK